MRVDICLYVTSLQIYTSFPAFLSSLEIDHMCCNTSMFTVEMSTKCFSQGTALWDKDVTQARDSIAPLPIKLPHHVPGKAEYGLSAWVPLGSLHPRGRCGCSFQHLASNSSHRGYLENESVGGKYFSLLALCNSDFQTNNIAFKNIFSTRIIASYNKYNYF